MTRKKPTLESHSLPCCGECKYCQQTKENIACYVEPPMYIYGEEDSPSFLAYTLTDVTRPACRLFERKVTQ